MASQSPEGHWGGSSVVATAVAALAIRGARSEIPPTEAAVDKAVNWLKSSDCTYSIATTRAELEARANAIEKSLGESLSYTNKEAKSAMMALFTIMHGVERDDAWRKLSLAVLDSHESVVTNGVVRRAMIV